MGKPWENHGKTMGKWWIYMENVAFIDDLPTRNGDFPSFLYCQRLYPVISCYIPGKKKRSLGFIMCIYLWVINHLLSGTSKYGVFPWMNSGEICRNWVEKSHDYLPFSNPVVIDQSLIFI